MYDGYVSQRNYSSTLSVSLSSFLFRLPPVVQLSTDNIICLLEKERERKYKSTPAARLCAVHFSCRHCPFLLLPSVSFFLHHIHVTSIIQSFFFTFSMYIISNKSVVQAVTGRVKPVMVWSRTLSDRLTDIFICRNKTRVARDITQLSPFLFLLIGSLKKKMSYIFFFLADE